MRLDYTGVRRVEDRTKIGYGNFKAVLDGGGGDGLLFSDVYDAGSLKVGEEGGFIGDGVIDYEVHYGVGVLGEGRI